jgi:hypothetical protein
MLTRPLRNLDLILDPHRTCFEVRTEVGSRRHSQFQTTEESVVIDNTTNKLFNLHFLVHRHLDLQHFVMSLLVGVDVGVYGLFTATVIRRLVHSGLRYCTTDSAMFGAFGLTFECQPGTSSIPGSVETLDINVIIRIGYKNSE